MLLRPLRPLRPLELTFELEDLHFAKSEVFLLLSFISDVNKLSRVSEAVVAEKDGLLRLELAGELGAGLVHGLVAFQKF